MIARLLAVLSLLAALSASDRGILIDPNGASADSGPIMDPNGGQLCYSACVDPNG